MSNKSDPGRGIVIGPGFRSIGPTGFQADTRDVPALIRRCLLYWDKIEWPDNNLVSLGNGPDGDFLQSAGILHRTRVNFIGSFSGDLSPVFAQGQVKVFEQLERAEPGVWTLAQESDRLRFPGQSIAERRTLEVQLYDLLPVPAETVAFADILEFRQHYASELLALRAVLERMYVEVLASPDPERMRLLVSEQLAVALRDVDRGYARPANHSVACFGVGSVEAH